jgi:hypothetical protein
LNNRTHLACAGQGDGYPKSNIPVAADFIIHDSPSVGHTTNHAWQDFRFLFHPGAQPPEHRLSINLRQIQALLEISAATGGTLE